MVQQQHIRILRRPALEQKTGFSRSTIYARLDPKSENFDADFPKPIKLGSGANPPVGWIESEVDAYLARLIERSRSAA